ncbi:MAG: phosphoenolpyruvate--protein phosphotransferase, partial [Vallitaleaceae bacterium]|nr:phosphoenolpyruvate--protein phosphotransferase [Vallitaleaceae bacterium]
MNVLKGSPISPGFAIGKVRVMSVQKTEIQLLERLDSEAEKDRFKRARLQAIEQVQIIYDEILETKGEKEAEIFSAHITMLEDSELIEGVENAIDDLKCNAEWALKSVADVFIEMFKSMDNAYMRERAMDIKDISDRIQVLMAGGSDDRRFEMRDPVVLVAHELTPSDTAQLKPELILGILNEEGGPTSHAAIIARMMGVPMLVYPGIMNAVKEEELIIFDGADGTLILEPTEEVLDTYKVKHQQFLKKKLDLERLKGTKAITTDGYEVQLVANIGTPNDVERVLQNDAGGVGLFRTELLYMSRDNIPDEEEQFLAYKEVVEKLKGSPVVIRTLDIGGDKELDYLEIPKEMNPFLGCRAIRFCLKKVDLWKIQLRALLRASAFGDLHIMFPMIA